MATHRVELWMLQASLAALSERAREVARDASASEPVVRVAAELLEALERAPSAEIALADLFATLMETISETYFGQPWASEHEFSVYARLVDDPRAWGYGGEDELEPLRWLREASRAWYDGKRLRDLEEWEPDYESWAEAQGEMVRQRTPGALAPPPFPPPH